MPWPAIPAIEALRARSDLLRPHAAEESGICGGGGDNSGAGYWGEYRYFQRVQCRVFKPLPYAEPDRIVMLWERQPDGTMGDVAPANFVDWQDGSRSFSGTAAVRTSSFAPSFIHGGQGNASRLSEGPFRRVSFPY